MQLAALQAALMQLAARQAVLMQLAARQAAPRQLAERQAALQVARWQAVAQSEIRQSLGTYLRYSSRNQMASHIRTCTCLHCNRCYRS